MLIQGGLPEFWSDAKLGPSSITCIDSTASHNYKSFVHVHVYIWLKVGTNV